MQAKLTSNIVNWSLTLVIVGIIALVSNWIGQEIMPQKAVPGILALMGIALVGMIIQKLVPLNIPSIAYIGILGLILTIPGVPGSAQLVHWTHNVELMALCTPVVAYAGISIGNSWADFAKLGWRTVVVGLVVLMGTYVGSAVVAQIVLKLQGII
ncbi:Uncharacterised protein [Staphylococcus piscifermentans]|uniref:DUF340 domain-containing protein n=2 Tax=Staphylococcus TaxID=1279 RepID=A0A239TH54_9STAP|nr:MULTISPECIES: hypothetical protein [Staphylococcus]AYU54299.1 hypothetical protein CNQ82_02115 [Staphylococcus debuckii]RTX83656.1 hypothetical protein CD139_08380 [Staphylococcus piscifermentans]GEP85343.1 hypothetical protein SPI02_19280 [Staphylococcus piscifermentans]SNU96966.1 Uncharacterised protein [Staphylococcus piscifermentans]